MPGVYGLGKGKVGRSGRSTGEAYAFERGDRVAFVGFEE